MTTEFKLEEIVNFDGIVLGTRLHWFNASTEGFGTLGPEATTGPADPGVRDKEMEEVRRFGERFARLTRQIRSSRWQLTTLSLTPVRGSSILSGSYRPI